MANAGHYCACAHSRNCCASAAIASSSVTALRRRMPIGSTPCGAGTSICTSSHASIFVLEKLGAVVGTSNLHIYAAMRGESLEDFLKTRNTRVLYSVAGDLGATEEWQEAKAK